MATFEGEKLSNNIIINDEMSDNEIVESDVPRGTCFCKTRIQTCV